MGIADRLSMYFAFHIHSDLIGNKVNLLAVIFLCGYSSFSYSEAWQIDPGIGVSAMHSDNVYLAADGSDTEQKKSETFIQVEPSFIAFHEGANSLADIKYRAQSYYFRDNSELNNTDHQMDARVSRWSSTRLFAIDLASTYSQQLIDPLQRLRNSNFIDDGNETDVITLRVQPTINYVSDSNFMFNLGYQLVDVNYKEEAENISDSRINNINSFIGSTDGSRFFGGARYKQDEVEYDNDIKMEFKSASIEAGVNIGDKTQLIAEAGEEKNEYTSTVGTILPEGSFWQLSLGWGASETNRVELGIGERYFGDTSFFSWQRIGSRFSMGAEYREDIKTDAQALIDRPIDINSNFISSGLYSPTIEAYISQEGSIFAGYDYSKTSIRIDSSQEQRNYQESGIEETRTQTGVSWQWLIMSRSTLNIRYSDIQYEYDRDISDTTETQSTVSLNRDIGEKTRASIMLGRNDRSSETSNISYVENFLSVNYSIIF